MRSLSRIYRCLSLGSLLAASGLGTSHAAEPLDLDVSLTANAGRGDLAPYYLMSNRHGILTQSAGILAEAGIGRRIDRARRFDWGFRASVVGGITEPTDYARCLPTADRSAFWVTEPHRPAPLFVREAYGCVKYRGVELTIGQRELSTRLLNPELSSGDLTMSDNTHAMPGMTIGFIDFQDIPLTNGWLQINGAMSYTKFMDKMWNRHHYNYANYHITEGSLMSYKWCYFRTRPSERLSVTLGMQTSTIFGGTVYYYNAGSIRYTRTFGRGFRELLHAFIPLSEGLEDFRLGSSLGSWDFMARYRLGADRSVKAYFEWLWEDGSGIGRRNGFDGLWGLELELGKSGWLTGIVAEYIDFTNHSGPLHWSPDDRPGTSITGHATGADNYYNNAFYNSYAYYGMSIGTPMMTAPIYNTDGYPAFAYNVMRGFHIAVAGRPTPSISYRAAVAYRKSWGEIMRPLTRPVQAASAMLEVKWQIPSRKSLELKAAVAFDHGRLTGNNTGAEIALIYHGKTGRKTPRPL